MSQTKQQTIAKQTNKVGTRQPRQMQQLSELLSMQGKATQFILNNARLPTSAKLAYLQRTIGNQSVKDVFSGNTIQRQSVPETKKLGPIAQARTETIPALDRTIELIDQALITKKNRNQISPEVSHALERFFPGETAEFLELLQRRIRLVRRLMPDIQIHQITPHSRHINEAVYRAAIEEDLPALVWPAAHPEFIAIFPRWYTEPRLRATRLVHELFHFAFPFVRNHPKHHPRANAFAYQGFVSILGGLTTGITLSQQYPE